TSDIQTALGLGVIDYIVKPFTFERFQMALTSYKERMRILSSEQELDQALLDTNFLAKKVVTHDHLRKGIDRQTLKTVQEAIMAYGQEFTINDIVPVIGLSRISLKKYVDYLEESGLLKSTLFYPAVGRPSKKYRVL
ncbi:MAG: response regulator, partial [Saezia sp.]